jgi:hypothetical protein
MCRLNSTPHRALPLPVRQLSAWQEQRAGWRKGGKVSGFFPREQMEAQFGSQVQYLVDFYHLCDYLSAAGDRIGANDKPAWMEEKKNWLKDNGSKDVLPALRPFLEPARLPDPEAPVRACFR